FETVLERRARLADRKETTKPARLNSTVIQTQQQLIIRQVRPTSLRQLQRKRRLPTTRRSNNQHPSTTLDHARAVHIKQPITSQRRTHCKRSRSPKQRIPCPRQFRKPNLNRTRAFEMDQRATKLEIELSPTGVTLSTLRNFKLIQIARDAWLRFKAGESNPNVG